MTANDNQVGGSHYRHAVQHWDIMAEYLGSAYFKGNATKYISRWQRKGGVQDLEKASHYLEKMIELVEAGKMELTPPLTPHGNMDGFVAAARLNEFEADMVRAIIFASGVNTIKAQLELLKRQIQQVKEGNPEATFGD